MNRYIERNRRRSRTGILNGERETGVGVRKGNSRSLEFVRAVFLVFLFLFPFIHFFFLVLFFLN